MDICDRIRARRIELGLSQEELGKKLGISKFTICKVEHGEGSNMTAGRVSAFAKALDCSETYLLGYETLNLGNPEADAEATNDQEFMDLWKKYSGLTEEQKASVRVLIGSYYRANN